MTVQATAAAQIALLRWIDRGFRFEPPARNWRFETRVLMNVVAELWSCPDTLADADCDSMRVPRGSTYGEAIQKIWREYFGEEEEPFAGRARAGLHGYGRHNAGWGMTEIETAGS